MLHFYGKELHANILGTIGGGAATAHRSQAVPCPCPISTCLGGVQAALPALQLLRHTRADNNDFSEKAN